MNNFNSCYLCCRNTILNPGQCGHNVCDDCLHTHSNTCLQCGLKINFMQLIDDHHQQCPIHKCKLIKVQTQQCKLSYPNCSSNRSSTVDSESTTHSNVNNFENNTCDIYSEKGNNQNKNKTNIKQFICAFHNQEIYVKHNGKNKFYCQGCNVKPEYVTKYTVDSLIEDLCNLKDYLKKYQYDIGFNIDGLLNLDVIKSKTILVLNSKIEQARLKYDSFIPYTDGKGPISRLNLRRLKGEKISKMFSKNKLSTYVIDESKINKYVNDLCKEYEVNPKSKDIDSQIAISIYKCVTNDWQDEIKQLIDTSDVSSKISLGKFKMRIKKLLLNEGERDKIYE
eukprot:Mrub_05189.p1 GENE.Mrub_05189~~Mrub_05189.p1  ORF type:complete len:337 (-),score=35.67 Mrub_05189:81-1091(-)